MFQLSGIVPRSRYLLHEKHSSSSFIPIFALGMPFESTSVARAILSQVVISLPGSLEFKTLKRRKRALYLVNHSRLPILATPWQGFGEAKKERRMPTRMFLQLSLQLHKINTKQSTKYVVAGAEKCAVQRRADQQIALSQLVYKMIDRHGKK